jgi:hypothetical protein
MGRPRNRWADVVQRDVLQLLGIKGWRRRAANRDEWGHFMREAKARKVLKSHRWIDGYERPGGRWDDNIEIDINL